MKEDVRQVAPASTTSNKEFHFYDYSALDTLVITECETAIFMTTNIILQYTFMT